MADQDEMFNSLADSLGGPRRPRRKKKRNPGAIGDFFSDLGQGVSDLFRQEGAFARDYSGIEAITDNSTLDSGAQTNLTEENTGAGRNDNTRGDTGTAENNPPIKDPETGEPITQDDPRYWEARRVTGTAGQFTESLASTTRDSQAGSASGVAAEGEGTVMRNRNNDTRSLYIGGNEGALPRLTFGKTAPEGFYEKDTPNWVNDTQAYGDILNKLTITKRRPDSELTSASEGDRAVQEVLSILGYDLTVDGYWGSETDAAIRQFKNDNGLGDNSNLDENTRRALEQTVRELRSGRPMSAEEERLFN